MAQALSIIIEAYPELETLYQQDIKFSDISPHIRYEIAKILAVMGEETWQRLGAQIKMSSDDIKVSYSKIAADDQRNGHVTMII